MIQFRQYLEIDCSTRFDVVLRISWFDTGSSTFQNSTLLTQTEVEFFLKKYPICDKFPRTHLYRPQLLEQRPPCRSDVPLKSVASRSCQFVDCRVNDKAFYRDAWWKFHCSRLRTLYFQCHQLKDVSIV